MIKEKMKNRIPISLLTEKEIEAEYKNLAKTADARIRRIEAKMSLAKYNGIQNWAYAKARNQLRNIIGLSDGKPRFDRSIKNLSRGQKETMLGHVRLFIDSPTSSLSGYEGILKRKTMKFNKHFNVNISEEEFNQIWQSERYKEMVDEYGYRDTFDSIIDALHDGARNIDDAIEIATRQKLINKYMERISKVEGNVRTYMDKTRNSYPEGFSEQLAKDLKDIRNNLAQGEKVPIMDMTKITPGDVIPDQIK